MKAFAAIDIGDAPQTSLLQLIPAKSFPGHPEIVLQIRLAVLSDKKQPKAHERSRFYLIHPEYDPATRRARGYRQRDRIQRHVDDPKYNGGRSNSRYDKNLRDEEGGMFDETFYDDDEASVISRRRAHDRRRSSGVSLSSSDGLESRMTRRNGKELFPDRSGRAVGRLRNRSASPVRGRSASPDRGQPISNASNSRYAEPFHKDNRRKAQILRDSLRSQQKAKELFPHKATHRRSGAFDAADETADLFASRMSVPFLDGSNDAKFRTRVASSFSIRGNASRQQSGGGGFSIKGAAKSDSPRELFPTRSKGSNRGKELFSEY